MITGDLELEAALDDWLKELPEGITIAKFPHRPLPITVDGVTLATAEPGPIRQRVFTVYSRETGMPTLLRIVVVATVPRSKYDGTTSYQVCISPEDSLETIKANVLRTAKELLTYLPAA